MMDRTAFLINESQAIINKSEQKGIVLRLFGSVAVRIHCPQYSYLLDQLNRIPNDIDFIGLNSDSNSIKNYFLDLNFVIDKYVLMISDGKRLLFNNDIKAEVVLDKLDYCHTIDLRNRIRFDYPTIPLADLLLSKLQIIELNKKDIEEILVLLLEHSFGIQEKETINIEYISTLLSSNWGFYYTATQNLNKILTYLSWNKIF